MALKIEGGGDQYLPTVLKNWIAMNQGSPDQYSMENDGNSRLIAYGQPAGYGFNESTSPEFLNSPFFRNTDNFEWAFDPQTGQPSLRVKTADKTGTTVQYRDDGQGNWVPDYGTASANQWETNNNDDFYKGVGSVLGAAVLGNVAAGSGMLGEAAQGAWNAGMTGAGAAGAAGSEAALAGLGGVEPISTSGFTASQGGIGSLGSGWGSSGIVAGEAGATAADLAAIGSGASPGMTALDSFNYTPFEENFLGTEANPVNPGAKPWYSDLIPDWKDLAKQGIKYYVNQQAGGAGGTAPSGGGFGGAGGGGAGPGAVSGLPTTMGQVPGQSLPQGGLIPPMASNPVSDAAAALAATLANRKGGYYG